jgi:hypothetical protein
MPRDHGVRLHDDERAAPVLPEPRDPDPQQAVRPSEMQALVAVSGPQPQRPQRVRNIQQGHPYATFAAHRTTVASIAFVLLCLYPFHPSAHAQPASFFRKRQAYGEGRALPWPSAFSGDRPAVQFGDL